MTVKEHVMRLKLEDVKELRCDIIHGLLWLTPKVMEDKLGTAGHWRQTDVQEPSYTTADRQMFQAIYDTARV